MPDLDSYNQTLFLEQEPVLEQAHSKKKANSAVKKPSPLIPLVIVAGLVFVVYLVLRTFTHAQDAPPLQLLPSPSPMASSTPEQDEINRLYNELEVELKQADPTVNILPFPPVQGRIFIDQ